MGGGASKKHTQPIDYIISVNYQSVDTISLQPDATLTDARKEIELDADDGIQGLPQNGAFQFVLSNGTPVAPRKESTRRVQDSLNDSCLVLRPTNLKETKLSEDKDDTKTKETAKSKGDDIRAAELTSSNDPTTVSTATASAGAAASTALAAIEFAEAAVATTSWW